MLLVNKPTLGFRTGDAVITVGGELKAEWCIHAVGPNYHMYGQGISGKESLEDGDRAVHNAYTSSMALGKAKGLKTIG